MTHCSVELLHKNHEKDTYSFCNSFNCSLNIEYLDIATGVGDVGGLQIATQRVSTKNNLQFAFSENTCGLVFLSKPAVCVQCCR